MPPRKEPQTGLGRAVRRLRDERGLTQEQLADRAGMDPTAVNRVEAGRLNPTWNTVRRIAGALAVSTAELAALADDLDPSTIRRREPR